VIKRIVKLTFASGRELEFLDIFEEMKEHIRGFAGCSHLELWRSTADPRIFFTYSWWDSEEVLDEYRRSALFAATWRRTRALFAERAEAWTVGVIA
jgi:heme-degrading monooxygenase HmoA